MDLIWRFCKYFNHLQNEIECASVPNTPPKMVMSTVGVINTSNKVIVENSIEMTWLLPK